MILQRLGLSERGDTLVEVMVALAILTSVLITTFTVANLTYGNGLSANQRSDAVALAQQEAEVFRNLRDNDLVTGPAMTPPQDPWSLFISQTFSTILHTPLCGSGSAYYLKPHIPAGTKNTWPRPSVRHNYVTTRTGTFDVVVTGCFPSAPDTDLVRFNISVSWPSGTGTQTSVLSTEIDNTSGITQIEPTL